MKYMNKLFIASIVMLVGASSVFAIGGILPDGQNTNHVYGTINGRNQILRDIMLTDVDASGATNIPSAGIVSLDASKLEAGTVATAIDGGAVTNLGAANIAPAGTLPQLDGSALTALDAANIAVGSAASAFDGSAITNIASAGIESLDASKLIAGTVASAIDGSAITNVTSVPGADSVGMAELKSEVDDFFITTNDTVQTKSGALSLNGGLTIGLKTIFTPSATQTLATGAAISANAAVVKIAGDGGAVTVALGDGTTEGQSILIRGTSDVNTCQITNITPSFLMGDGDVLSATWDASAWQEIARRDN